MLGAKKSVISRRRGELAGHEAMEGLLVVGEHVAAALVLERAVDVAGVALALVQLGHEGDRHALLGCDLLGAGLVDHVVVGGGQRLVVVEVDLVLAEVALALRVLHSHARAAIELRMRRISGSTRAVPIIE